MHVCIDTVVRIESVMVALYRNAADYPTSKSFDSAARQMLLIKIPPGSK